MQIMHPVFIAPVMALLPYNSALFECGVPDSRTVVPDAAIYTLDGKTIVQEFEVKVRVQDEQMVCFEAMCSRTSLSTEGGRHVHRLRCV
jgi:hypothetical protein